MPVTGPRPERGHGAGVVGAVLLVLTLTACSGSPGGTVSRNAGAGGGTARPGVPFLPEERMSAPLRPPTATLVVPPTSVTPRRVALDWSARGGAVERPPQRVDWPVASLPHDISAVVLDFGTEQIPSRVVLYEYPGVSGNGVPEEGTGRETLCAYDAPENPCFYAPDRERRTVRLHVLLEPHYRPYWVIQAAWLVPSPPSGSGTEVPGENSISWLIRFNRP
ncbi:hypothetical protein LI90_1170 [Carbonactinospora thermoautotrophica]|uniref:Lipoprotein n=1 Tax=Carbonactinospora thermoautotrophica TaxID=1469144 RepID=A0A132MNT8_9ACTN|nr:hypothetical protein LI90_1170 [Carbonactinospora thermoautotrophica]